MQKKIKDRNIVVVNQAVNYLTVGICNAFADKFETVDLITGNIHEQGEALSERVTITGINRYASSPQKKKFISYFIATVRIYLLLMIKFRKYEVFFVSAPPMAYLLKIMLPHRVSIFIWDVYPDMFKITGMKETHPLYRIWAFLNRIVFKRTYRLFTIGRHMAGLLEKYVERERILITPIWSVFQSNGRIGRNENPFIRQEGLEDKFIVQYSGNIGLTHNVEVMVELAEMMKNYEGILFQIIGRGPRVPHLKELVRKKRLPNCQFLPFQSDEMFPYSLSAADIGVVILDEATSKGSVPSKSYNLMSYGIPSLYIAASDSELHDYAEMYRHAECFVHNRLEDAVEYILKLYKDREKHSEYSVNALKAAKNYRRLNADKLVELYLNNDE